MIVGAILERSYQVISGFEETSIAFLKLMRYTSISKSLIGSAAQLAISNQQLAKTKV